MESGKVQHTKKFMFLIMYSFEVSDSQLI